MCERADLSYYQRNRDAILNSAKDYYENNKDMLSKQAKNKYRDLSEEEENEKTKKENRYHNMSEEKKRKLKEYQKTYCETKIVLM